MADRKQELQVLALARPLLHSTYGGYRVDENQKDSPDAAIHVSKPHKKFGSARTAFDVGIEITCVDDKKSLAYFKDEKFGREKINAQIEASITHNESSSQPHKKRDIAIHQQYIYNNAIKKADKYAKYAAAGKFHEVILLCFSDYLETKHTLFQEGVKPWSDYLLSREAFPFDKVIFVDLWGGKPALIYDKSQPMLTSPPAWQFEGSSVTSMQGPMMRFDQPYNINDIFSQPPLVEEKRR